MESVTDGTSNTLMLGEGVLGGNPNDILGGVAVGMQQWRPQDCWNRVSTTNRRLLTNPVRADFRPTGGRAWDGRPYFVGFSTLIPPNGPACQWGNPDNEEQMGGFSSHHPGGAQAAMADGHVQFVNQTIDTGNPTVPDDNPVNRSGPSPYGVWGAMGSRNGGEAVALQ